jgi:hypothetical protein
MHRKITEWEWYSDIKVCRLFIHMLLKANHAPGRWQGIDILPGQLIIGRSSLSEETGLSEQEIRTVMNKLKSTGEITSKATNRFTVITICKYSEYQCCALDDQPADQPTEQPTSNQQSTTNKNNNKKEENKNNGLFDEFWTAYPKKVNKPGAKKAWDKKQCGNGKFESVMEALKRQIIANNWSKENMQYIPHPATWLNCERWGDEIVDKQTGKKRGTCSQCANNYLPRCKEKSEEERARCNHFAEVEA